MLSHLSIRHIALIDQLELDIPAGFVVITGETGAGKSVVIDSVNLVLGERADRSLIQTGQGKASVEALFDDMNPHTSALLHQNHIEMENGQLILARELTAAGKNTCRLNGRLSSLSVVKEASDLLVDLHGQHEHQNLLRASSHLSFLDAYGGKAIERAQRAYASASHQWHTLHKQLHSSWGSQAERNRQRDILRYQIEEIEAAQLTPGEEEKQKQERDVWINLERIQSSLSAALCALAGDDEQIGSLSLQKMAIDQLRSISALDERYLALQKQLEESYYLLDDAASELRHMSDLGVFDPQRYNQIEQRLDTIHQLERKYGATIDDVLRFAAQAQEELLQLDAQEELAEHGQKRLQEQAQQCYALGETLHRLRVDAAKDLSQQLKEQLSDLGMEKAIFDVHFSDFPAAQDHLMFPESGLDSVEFLLSTNPNEPLKPLQKIASGGELSRIMLAFKTISAQRIGCETLIFDEIDTGISGQTSFAVGQKMHNIAQTRQVICVTHSPQIVAFADHHLRIWKKEGAAHSSTHVETLDEAQHVQELARLISGNAPSENAIKHAQDLITNARKKQ